jgi:hypothetical protein
MDDDFCVVRTGYLMPKLKVNDLKTPKSRKISGDDRTKTVGKSQIADTKA